MGLEAYGSIQGDHRYLTGAIIAFQLEHPNTNLFSKFKRYLRRREIENSVPLGATVIPREEHVLIFECRGSNYDSLDDVRAGFNEFKKLYELALSMGRLEGCLFLYNPTMSKTVETHISKSGADRFFFEKMNIGIDMGSVSAEDLPLENI